MKTITEVARMLGKTRMTVWLWVRLGKVKAELQMLPTGQSIWLIPESEIERLKAKGG